MDQAGVAEARHDAADDHRVGLHGFGHDFGRHWPICLGHVKQDVKDA
jgi:hypothetical protein